MIVVALAVIDEIACVGLANLPRAATELVESIVWSHGFEFLFVAQDHVEAHLIGPVAIVLLADVSLYLSCLSDGHEAGENEVPRRVSLMARVAT